jgi:hypothetical protein
MNMTAHVSTGHRSLDSILDGLRLGDNVVWSVEDLGDYQHFVLLFVAEARRQRRKVLYLRFAEHAPLLDAAAGVTIHHLDAGGGFEAFASRIHQIITEEGREAFYVFDCLSDLLTAWATDLMIGNFFQVTCPYLYELDTVAYFALRHGHHSHKTFAQILKTTQLLLNLHHSDGQTCVHPVKVWQRKSPTMFLPHLQQGDAFVPVANSYEATRLVNDLYRGGLSLPERHLDYWFRLFLRAEDLAGREAATQEREQMVDQLCRFIIGRDERILDLARRYFSLEDLLAIKSRMIGTGYIGGKAVGMLLAHHILLADRDYAWAELLETHDSFFIGSDVYYTFLVHNGWWKLLMQQKSGDGYFRAAAQLREKILQGELPGEVRQELRKMLDYYGQYPIIVRSSSLLEDGFGNAFAGKYDSFFLANQGSPEERYAALEDAIRRIFASAMSEDALAYRLQRGLDQQEEQMALLVQRVSGVYRQHYYFPDLAGVGVSYNTFVWDREMDRQAGMLRMVLGLGTRAVDRVEGDYPRLVALDAPLKQPHKGIEDTRRFSQRDVDLLNINDNALQTVPLLALDHQKLGLDLERFGVRDRETARLLEDRRGDAREVWLLTFDRLLADTPFPAIMQRLLKTLEKAYNYPVDMEFTVNFAGDGTPRINVVQCRPLQTKGEDVRVELPAQVADEQLFFRSEGNFMGGSISQPIRRIIHVDAEAYSQLPLSDKYEVARLIGRLNRRISDRRQLPTMLLGPGRWGTSTPALGVPVTFAEINHVVALGEIAFSSGGLMPELSFGSHFFQDLVETDIFYLALFPDQPRTFFNRQWLDSLPNALEGLMPASSRFRQVVKVCHLEGDGVRLMADLLSQKLLCLRT